MMPYRSAVTLMDLHQLSTSDGEPLEYPTRYPWIVGTLVYLTTGHPNIDHAICMLS